MHEDHFRALHADTFDDVWRFARRRTGSGTEADDVTAETFAVAWRRRDAVPGEEARLWLFGVARNVLANHRRDATRRARLHLRVATHDPAPEAVRHEDHDTGAAAAVWSSLAALSRTDRDLLLMRAWDGLSVAEMAVVLGVAPATVSSRLHRARRRMARELERRDPGGTGQVPSDPPYERSHR
jgi:RNA polymerase sigma-70 factor (ECF subfamily)